ISTVAGNNTAGYSGDGGAPTTAQLNGPAGVAFDAAGNLYIAEVTNNVIREVTASSLPIQLISFTGSPLEDKIKISWETASEQNNSFFTLEKSINGIDFLELCRIPGAINSSIVNAYDCEDSLPFQGENYYRLKQTDVNGHEQLFEVIAVNYTGNNELQLYPNPAGEDRIVHLSLTMGSSVNEISVYNSLNEIVFQDTNVQHSRGRDLDTYAIQLSPQLAAGLYHIAVNTTSNVFNENLLLLK
ncbi:MAG TPA: T9SS type A sorting domain-containing protein, partial [Cytophagaceae bacterium]|nr:T9SS type A sorting domain-containing protein [Cytophagaceae bacterium]